MLVLPIKKKWFDLIVSGKKKEEYREIKPYYDTRLRKYFRNDTGCGTMPKTVIFRNGYSKKSPQIKCLCNLRTGLGQPIWGAVDGKMYYILRIIEVYKEEK